MFACGIGAPPEVLRRTKALGKETLALIGSPHHIQRAVAAGVDMLVAQGYEAGAHTAPSVLILWRRKLLTQLEMFRYWSKGE